MFISAILDPECLSVEGLGQGQAGREFLAFLRGVVKNVFLLDDGALSLLRDSVRRTSIIQGKLALKIRIYLEDILKDHKKFVVKASTCLGASQHLGPGGPQIDQPLSLSERTLSSPHERSPVALRWQNGRALRWSRSRTSP